MKFGQFWKSGKIEKSTKIKMGKKEKKNDKIKTMKIGKNWNWKIDNNSISTKLSKPFSNFASKLQYILTYFHAKNHQIIEEKKI